MKLYRRFKTWHRIALLLSVSLSGVLPSAADGNRQWSADLSAHGLKDGRGEDGRHSRPVVSVAATNGVVAVAWGIPLQPVGTSEQANRWGAPREVTLLLFDANNGKLMTKRGPWRADLSFELYATAQGNFLLYLRHSQGEKQDLGDTLYLLSSTGEELKKLYLLPSVVSSKTLWSEFMVSSSGRTVLLGQIRDDGVHYRLLESNTLESKLEWTDATGSHPPRIVALSDTELLGFRNPENQEKLHSADGVRDLYVRTFDGPWRRLPGTFDVSHRGGTGQGLHPTQLAFLSDEVLVGVNATRKEVEGSIVLLQPGSTTVSSVVIPKLPDRTTLSGPVAVSAAGRYFAVGFRHQPWISHLLVDEMTLDITFWSDDSLLLVWEAYSPDSVARIPLGTEVRALCFSPDDPPTVAFVNGSTLKVIRIQPKSKDAKAN